MRDLKWNRSHSLQFREELERQTKAQQEEVEKLRRRISELDEALLAEKKSKWYDVQWGEGVIFTYRPRKLMDENWKMMQNLARYIEQEDLQKQISQKERESKLLMAEDMRLMEAELEKAEKIQKVQQ